MIVVALSVRHEQEEQKLEQVEDVSVLLSRELAGSLVMNALPTSPPAVLHNYHTSPIDINPQHALMPVIELHEGFIRDHYTGRTYPRNELLLQDNAFDAYLDSLTPAQLLAVRIDVYAISEFYIIMSIFKSHDHQPRHWHFLGDPATRMQGLDTVASLPGPGTAGGAGDIMDALDPGFSGGPPSREQAWPEDVLPDTSGSGFDNYPDDETLFGNEDRRGGQLSDRSGNSGVIRNLFPETGDASPSMRFRAARPDTARTDSGPRIEIPFDLHLLLRALNTFMVRVQDDSDNNLPSILPHYDFLRDVLGLLPQLPEFENPDNLFLFRELEETLKEVPDSNEQAIHVTVENRADTRGQAIAVPVNRRVEKVSWLRDAAQPPLAPLPESITMSLQLGLHAEIYQGLHVSLARGTLLMTPLTDTLADPGFKWRVVTLVNPAATEFVTGFVYAALDADSHFLLPVEENAITIDGLRVTPHYPVVSHRRELWQLLFYSLLVILLVTGMLTYRRTR